MSLEPIQTPSGPAASTMPGPAGAASVATCACQVAVARRHALNDPAALADARRGFIAAPSGQIRNARGRVVWDFDSFDFLHGEAPATVNPSLWRQAILNNQVGLFQVSEGIWQLRGFDLVNLTLIEGATGWIVVDPLTTSETAAAALAFAQQHLGERPVMAVIFTHSHLDHFGGVLGVLDADEARERRVPIVAPTGFMEEATSENILLGTAMGRRAMYMYGARLARDPAGLVDNGLGKANSSGRVGILPPTVLIDRPRQELTLDGVPFVFHNAPGAEAPAELVFALPRHRAFCGAELVGHTLHNLYTLRGAKVRDALLWADYIDAMIDQACEADVLFNQHHWPVWGRDGIARFLKVQRDAYRYIHDQTVRGLNRGQTAPEVAEALQLPPGLDREFAVHGYYGTVKHNVRAVAQHYLGWFDGHPATLDPLPPVEGARRYVLLAGGAEAALAQARAAYDQGDYRWAAELLRHVVLADASNVPARELQALAFEQLGFQAESSAWRNFYLTGALELRQGPPQRLPAGPGPDELLVHTPTGLLLQWLGTHLDGAAAGEWTVTLDAHLIDTDEHYRLWLEHAVLHHRRLNAPQGDADVSLALPRRSLLALLSGAVDPIRVLEAAGVKVEGDAASLRRLLALMDSPAGNFPIVTR